jgi:FkbM family methyltransferase
MRTAASLIRNVHRGSEIFRCAWETDQWRAVTLAYLGVRNLNYPYSLKLKGLEPLTLKEVSDIWTFWQIFARQVYPLTGLESVIVDAGANVGFFTLLAARQARNCKVVAIEPAPESYRRLVENVEKNGLADRVLCLNYGLAGQEESRVMRVGQSRSQVQRLLPRDATEATGSTVQTVTLNSVLRDITFVDMLKMDIEGGEYETLYGSSAETLRKIRRVVLEYHPDEGSSAELLSFLGKNGLTLKHDVHNSKGYGLAIMERKNE